MSSMSEFLRKNLILIIILIIASLFYCYELRQTFVMAGDTARDLINIMKIWQNKEITIVGGPVNTISNNPIQVFFGSLPLYFGLLGLLIFNFDPVASVFMNIILTLISIPFFFLLSKEILKKKNLALLSTFIYSCSPITVALARSYWEPNTVVPLSVFVWFFFLYPYKRFVGKYFLAGFLSGIIFVIHYMNIIPLALYIIFLFFRKNKSYFIYAIAGFFLAVSPLIAFEIKNHFFLIRAFTGTFGGFSTFSERTLNPFLSMDIFFYIFGLGPAQYFFPALFNWTFNFRVFIGSIIGIAYIFFLFKKQKLFNLEIVGVILISLISGWYFEKWHILALRYMLSVYPLFIISFIAFISSFRAFLVLFLLIPMLFLSITIITHKLNPNLKADYYPVNKIEEISDAIVLDNPMGAYNVTENILGDAQSLSFRYFLLRDARVKPQPVEIYDRIDTLYLITPSLDKTYEEGRWEFSASGPKKIVWEKNFGDLKLYKFTKQY